MFRHAKLLSVGLVTVAALGYATQVYALEKQTIDQGRTACWNFCTAKNKTRVSQNICRDNCDRYWLCNGSDATPETCAVGRA